MKGCEQYTVEMSEPPRYGMLLYLPPHHHIKLLARITSCCTESVCWRAKMAEGIDGSGENGYIQLYVVG